MVVEHILEVVNIEVAGQRGSYHPSHARSGRGCYDNLYLCGRCRVIVARDVPLSELEHALIRCPNCGASNQARHLVTHLAERTAQRRNSTEE